MTTANNYPLHFTDIEFERIERKGNIRDKTGIRNTAKTTILFPITIILPVADFQIYRH